MTTSFIKRCDLLGSLVIDQNIAEEIGNIAQLYVNVRTHQVEQIKCTSGFLGYTARYFRWNEIKQISADCVLVDGGGDTVVKRPESMSQMVGLEVWSESDNKVGLVGDYCFSPNTGHVVDYVFVLNNLRGIVGGAHRLPPTNDSSVAKLSISRLAVDND